MGEKTHAAAPRGNRSGVLLALACILVKALFVVALADVFYYGEELEKGTAAKALLDGLDVPYWRLPFHPYEGGGFVVSHLKALAFLLVGESVLAHKLVAIASCLAVLAAGRALARRHFGENAALVFGLAFLFGPRSFQELSLLSLGIHFEASFFVIVVLDRALRLAGRREARGAAGDAAADVRDAAWLGLASGFGIYFSYQLAIAAAFAGGLLVLVRPSFFKSRAAAAGALAFALGIAPLLAMAAAVGSEVFDIHGTGLVERGAGGALPDFLRSIYVEGGLELRLSALLYPAALVASLVATRRDPAARRLAAFLALWTAVYLASGFVVGEVLHSFALLRFAPFWVVSTLIVAAALARARGRAARVFAAALLAVGVAKSVAIVASASPLGAVDNVRVLATTRGVDYAGYLTKLFGRLEGSRAEQLRACSGFDEPARELLRADLATAFFRNPGEDLDSIRAVIEAVDPDGLADYVRGLGPWLAARAGRDLGRAIELAREASPDLRGPLEEAVGRFGVRWVDSPDLLTAHLAELSRVHEPDALLHGLGHRAWRRLGLASWGREGYVLRPEAIEALLEGAPAAREGLSHALAQSRVR